jgi:hypothetical protein
MRQYIATIRNSLNIAAVKLYGSFSNGVKSGGQERAFSIMI